MVSEAVRLADKNARALVSDAVRMVRAINSTPEALSMIRQAALDHLANLQREVELSPWVGLHRETREFTIKRFDVMRSGLVSELDNHRTSFTEPKNKGGRPTTWDWEGAWAHMVAIANTPNGLPTDYGAQAKIADSMKAWFGKMDGSHPDEKEIKKRARAIQDAIKALGKGGN